MCASCGCGCKPGKAAKGCKCTCKTCREARTMSVEKSFIVSKGFRDLEVLAKSMDVPPTQVHTGYASPGSRYCDDGSCATCIKQASRDKNARQTHSHVTKGYLVSIEDVEKGYRINALKKLAMQPARKIAEARKGVAPKKWTGDPTAGGRYKSKLKYDNDVEKGLPSVLKTKNYQELSAKGSAMMDRAYEASAAGNRSVEPSKISSALDNIAGKHRYGMLARESKRAGDENQARIWIEAGQSHKRRSPANFNGWRKTGRIEGSDAGKRMQAVREKRLARQKSLAFAKPTLNEQNKPSW